MDAPAQPVVKGKIGMRWNRSWGYAVLVAAIAATLLSACGAATTAPPTGAAVTVATATATSTATVKPTTTNAATTGAGASSGCGASTFGNNPESFPLEHVGDLTVSQAAPGLTYPATQIPAGTPNQPLKLTNDNTIPGASALPINPAMKETGGGFAFIICNASSTSSHTVKSISVRVASFTAYSGALAAWSICTNGTYDAQTQAYGAGGCGGGLGVNEALHATFASGAGVGATVTATQTGSWPTAPSQPDPFPGLPITLRPGDALTFNVGLTAPTTPGTYTFAFGVAADSAAPAYFSTTSPALLAPITQAWSGANCNTAAMKSQIPTATQATYYICPPA